MKKLIILPAIAIFAIGCMGTAPSRTNPTPDLEFRTFEAPLLEPLEVDIGGKLFVEGQVARLPAFVMQGKIDSTMPGAMGIPFSFSINQTTLTLRYRRGEHDYYCAPKEDRAASFPGLGSVVDPRDCVGIRVHISTEKKEWVVDNSYHNNQVTVWSRHVKQSDGVLLNKTKSDDYAVAATKVTEIVFDGFYSGLLHFTLRRVDGERVNERTFKFDYPPRVGDPIYGINGTQFEILHVDNTGMTYQWIDV